MFPIIGSRRVWTLHVGSDEKQTEPLMRGKLFRNKKQLDVLFLRIYPCDAALDDGSEQTRLLTDTWKNRARLVEIEPCKQSSGH